MPVFELLGAGFFEHLALNLVALAVLIRFGLAGDKHVCSSSFIHYMFGMGVFFATYILRLEEISLGFSFGLFAIFSMLRYRTEQLMIREMTYLFLVVIISLLCGVSPLGLMELAIVVSLVVMIALLAETSLFGRQHAQKTVRYEKIENIRPENREKLLLDLRERTGLDVRKVQIVSVDFMQDSAMLLVTE